MSKMSFRVVMVTPAMAVEWLKRNRKNRPINKAHVRRLVRDMAAGRWVPTPQPITFDVDRDLIDGQHRLTAIVESGVACQTTICEGAARESLRGIDMGTTRDAGGILAMLNGITAEKRALSIANAMMWGIGGHRGEYTKTEQAEFFLEHSEAIAYSIAAVPPQSYRLKKSGIGAVIARAFYSVDRSTLNNFCRALVSGVSVLPEDATVILLRDFAMQVTGNGKGVTCAVYRKAARALDAYRKGEVLGRLYEAPREPFPLPSEASKPALKAVG